MPFVRIDLIRGRSEEDIAAIGESVQRALIETMGVPERDRFQVITEHAPGRLIDGVAQYLVLPKEEWK